MADTLGGTFNPAADMNLTGTVTVSGTLAATGAATGPSGSTAGTSAALIVGDTADPDGYFASTDLKATDLLVGECLDTTSSTLWGDKEGAYLVAATGQRGPVATNFCMYYKAGSNVVFSVTKVGTGTAGRTHVQVTYSIGEVVAQVVT